MKLKHFGLLTLASMAMIACNNENEGFIGEQDNSPKKVVLKLEGISSGNSRSTDGTTSSNTVSLKDVAIFLYADGGVIYNALEIGSTDTENWGKITGAGYTFTDVDPAVNRVMVIGNYDNLETNNSFGTAASLVNSTAANLMAEAINLQSQNIKAQESGSGTPESTKAVMTLFGNTTENIQDKDGDGIYEAAVSIKPIVSRLEVKSVSCKFVEPVGTGGIVKSATVTVEGIGLFDYYNNMTLDGKALTGLMDATKILEPGAASASDGQYVFLGDAPEWAWAYDKTTTGYKNELKDQNTTGNPIEMTLDPSGAATFAYNFFPVASGTTIDGVASQPTNQALANIRLYVNVTNSTSGTNKDYVVTTAFRDASGTIVTPAPGKIYQLDYAFETDNIRDNWGDDKIKVNVTVTTVNWEIVPVTPSF